MNDSLACILLVRYAMQCQICSKLLAAGAPIYRLPLPNSSGRIGVACVCSGCVSGAPFKGRQWQEPVPCDHCARPVISFRKVPRHVCGPECWQAIRNTQGRRRGGQWCRTCGQTFSPKRIDALFCSAACRQRAYRRRLMLYREAAALNCGNG
jgi:hypothetical protein